MSKNEKGMGGAFNWDDAELMAPECSPRWDADGMTDWQGEREGPYLHITWCREFEQSLIAVVYDPTQQAYAAARWDGPVIGWTKDASSGSLMEVMTVKPLVQGKANPPLDTSHLSAAFIGG